MSETELELAAQAAAELMLSVEAGNRRLEGMLQRGLAVAEKINCMRDYQSSVDAMSAQTASGERRRALLGDLQQENRQIIAFQEENRELKEAVEQCFSTLDAIMYRHRKIMQRVCESSGSASLEKVLLQVLPCNNTPVHEVKDQFREFASRVLEQMNANEMAGRRDAESLSRLAKENNVLRELLSHASMTQPDIAAQFRRRLAMEEVREGEGENDDDDDANVTVLESNRLVQKSSVIEKVSATAVSIPGVVKSETDA